MQMEKACLLPVAVAGALMPDAHVGYGLPHWEECWQPIIPSSVRGWRRMIAAV